MNIFKKRRALYLAGLVCIIAIAVLLKEVWHRGGSMLFFYLGGALFGLTLFGIGFLMLFFPSLLIRFFGGVRVETRPIWQRMEVISMGLTTMLVGGVTLGLMIYRFIVEFWLLSTSLP